MLITFLPQRYYKIPNNPYIMHKYPPTPEGICVSASGMKDRLPHCQTQGEAIFVL